MKQYTEQQITKYKDSIRRCDAVGLKSHEYYRTQGFLAAYEDVLRVIEEQEELNCKKMNHAMREETTEEEGSRSNPKA